MSTAKRLVWLVLVAVGASACVTPKPPEILTCGQEAHTHKLKFKLKADGCVESVLKDDGTDGTEVTVCRGDTIKWKIGLLDKNKSVAFDKGDGSPFEWPDSGFKGWRIKGVVLADAAPKPYGYSVRTKGPPEGCPLDPIIIIRN